jgi:hypothetical protein
LRTARDCDRNTELALRGRSLELPAAGIRCLDYTVSLRAAQRDTEKIVISPTLWMWRPRLGRDDEILASFSVPDAMRVFVPWQMLDTAGLQYRLAASPESGTATAAFGNLDQRVLQIAGAQLRVVALGEDDDITLDPLLDWLRSTAANIATVSGRFPSPNASVILVPANDRDRQRAAVRPVTFGRAVRDGGESIVLRINPGLPTAEYYREWTPTHEFAHLLLPYLNAEQRWISEGFAQYYQNVLLARAGQYSATDAWQKIHAGLQRGLASAPGLSPNEAADQDTRDTRMKVYWSGAALALIADVELRRRSAGTESLDSVLGELQRCCLPSARAWSGVELFGKLDELLDEPLFMRLYRRYADAGNFPDTGPVLAELGVLVEAGQVRLDASAALADIRNAITRVAATH